MYDYIIGQVMRHHPEYIVVENNGIGWQIYTPNSYAFPITKEAQQIYVHMHVREDAQLLFGFKTLDERELFRKLIQVSGIGPKGALAILASGNPYQVIAAIEAEDDAFLIKFPGVGKKTARQMILDLKGKLGSLMTNVDVTLLPNTNLSFDFQEEHDEKELQEALLALSALGYSEKELAKIKPMLLENKELSSTDEYMKHALKLLLTLK